MKRIPDILNVLQSVAHRAIILTFFGMGIRL